MFRRTVCTILCTMALSFGTAARAQTVISPEVAGVGTTTPIDIKADGGIAGKYVDSTGNTHAFLFKDGDFTSNDPSAALTEGGTCPAYVSPRDPSRISASRRGSWIVGHSIQRLNVLGTLGENRPLDVHLWYPARLGDCDDSGCFLTPSTYTLRLHGVPLPPQWDPLSWTIGTSGSFEGLPILSGDLPLPVIIFSHGSVDNAIDYVYTLEGLARAGFIVAAPDHLNNTADDALIDFINSQAGSTLISCSDGLAPPCSRADVAKSATDRAHDVSAVIDALPTWFGDRADVSRVGVMGHSRGSVTALAAAGGSATWGFPAEPRVRAIMGLAAGTQAITFSANIQAITVPALLIAGELDPTAPSSQSAFNMLASTEKAFVLIDHAEHRHFNSGLCAEMQSSGGIAAANSRAILDLQTARMIATSSTGVPMDFCRFETFVNPTDIRPLVASLTGFTVTADSVPTTHLNSGKVRRFVTQLAVSFFGFVFERDTNDNGSFTDFLASRVQNAQPNRDRKQ